jgi:acetylornithine deacetylase/succinyl-diaminopimelate desuccinylase-like protein
MNEIAAVGSHAALADLAASLVRLDSRSSVSNLPVADRIEAELTGFEVERLDFLDQDGVPKRALVARRGRGGLAFSGHMDTVPATGWTDDPFDGRIDEEGVLHGLGSADMKGPVAAIILAARSLPPEIPVALLITTDEETTKQGARTIVERSALARDFSPRGIVVAEPTGLAPVRGHRAHVLFTATATGVQAHSSTGRGRNANWALLPFLTEMRGLYERLATDPALRDDAYDPAVSDFNLVLDNHGTAVNVTVPRATALIKFRYSAGIDPAPVIEAVRNAASRAGLSLEEAREGRPPELPTDHPLVRLCESVTGQPAGTVPYGTDASVLTELAPCIVLGPGSIDVAHTPREHVRLADLAAAVSLFAALATQAAASNP